MSGDAPRAKRFPAQWSSGSRPAAPSSGLTEDEARGFHGAFIAGFIGFTIIAAIAHLLVWQWRPWIPGTAGYQVGAAQTAPATNVATR